jgi:transposase InsO family protein
VLAIEVDTSLRAERLVRVFERLKAERGVPDMLRVNNGPEFLSQTLIAWSQANGVFIDYIQPGKPNQNAYIERFNRSLRNEVLNLYLFRDLDEVREIVSAHLIMAWVPKASRSREAGYIYANCLSSDRICTLQIGGGPYIFCDDVLGARFSKLKSANICFIRRFSSSSSRRRWISAASVPPTNLERMHQGYRLKSRTPAQALRDALGVEELPPFIPDASEETTVPDAA